MKETPAPGPREFVTTHWSLVGAALEGLGLKLDYERIKSTRPRIAEMLR